MHCLYRILLLACLAADAEAGIIPEAYLKASNTGAADLFGSAVAVSGDTLVIGAYNESSKSTGINGDQTDNSLSHSGAAYVFVRTGTNWLQQAYLKASNPGANDQFGRSLAISGDTIVVSAVFEGSSATGVNGDGSNNNAPLSGAVYVFVREGTNWTQQAYLKASNTGPGNHFGHSVAISRDTLIIGSDREYSAGTGINGDQSDRSAALAGAVYVFVREGTNWSQQAYIKPSNTGAGDWFGNWVSLSGETFVVGAPLEDSGATGVNGNGADNSLQDSGAAYVFVRTGTNWSQQAYLKASNTGAGDSFGACVAISGDCIVVGADSEDSSSHSVNGVQMDEAAANSGAAYVFVRSGTNWSQQAYLKASNNRADSQFGISVALQNDTIVVGAPFENSSAIGVNGDSLNLDAPFSGAAYGFVRSGTNWAQQAYIKASNTGAYDYFGSSAYLWDDRLVVGATGEASNAVGVNGSEANNSAPSAGAVYVFSGLDRLNQLVLRPNLTGGFVVQVNGIAGLQYQLQQAPTPMGPWTRLTTLTAPRNGQVEFPDLVLPVADGQAFFRTWQE